MSRAGLAELLDWGGLRARPALRRHLVVDALDAFPGAAGDRATLEEDLSDVLEGAARLAGATGSDSVHLLVAEERVRADLLRKRAGAAAGLSVLTLPSLHPLGDPAILSSWLATHPRFDGSTPRDFEVIAVDTAAAIGSAARGRLRLERWVSVAGRVRRPATLRVPLGTTVATLLRLAGGAVEASVPYVVRGAAPRRAPLSRGIDRPDAAVLFLALEHPWVRNDAPSTATALRRLDASCDRCGLCQEACPAGAGGLPLLAFLDAARWGGILGPPAPDGLADCVGCRLCEASCPVQLPVGRLVDEVARRLRREGARPARPQEPRLVPREAFRRRLGLGPDPTGRRDARTEVRRVRLPLREPGGVRARPCRRPGDEVWRGEAVAIFPESGGRVLAPFTGRVRSIDGAVTVGRLR